MSSAYIKRLVLLMCIVLCGCGAGNPGKPKIDLVTIPPESEGGPDTTGTIAGRVTGAAPGQQIVLYAKSGLWYVQPLYDAPFTPIARDGSWTSETHLGTDYAAMLVEPSYQPSGTLFEIPPEGGGVAAVAVMGGTPPFWRRHWVQGVVLLLAILAGVGWYRGRMRELTRQLNVRSEERLAERTRIAQELHDTLLQGLVSASMQLHVGLDLLPADSPARPVLGRAAELMGQVLVEGRNALRGLGSADDGTSLDLEQALSHIREELAANGQVDYRFVVHGRARQLHPLTRDAVYGIARQAMVDAIRHAGATKVEAEVDYAKRRLRLLVRDDGRAIARGTNGSEQEARSRLTAMRELAESIGGRLDVRSHESSGTEIELTVPGTIAYRGQSRS